jgi:hypothetical protein
MAGTTRGAIKGWITRRKSMGLSAPDNVDDATDEELMQWAETKGYRGRGSKTHRAKLKRLEAEEKAKPVVDHGLDNLPEVDDAVSLSSLRERNAEVLRRIAAAERRDDDQPLFSRPERPVASRSGSGEAGGREGAPGLSTGRSGATGKPPAEAVDAARRRQAVAQAKGAALQRQRERERQRAGKSKERTDRARSKATSPGQEPRVGDVVGGEVVSDAERREAIGRAMAIASERGKKQGGKHVYKLRKALLQDGKGAYERILHEHGLTHLTERQRLDLLIWMFENVEPDDLTRGAQNAGKGPERQKKLTPEQRRKKKEKEAKYGGIEVDFGSRQVNDDGSVFHEGPGRQGGPVDERKATQRKTTATDRPGTPKSSFIQRGVAELKFGTKSSAKRRRLSGQSIINPGGPRKKNADPTADRAMRRAGGGSEPFTMAEMTPGAKTGIARRRRDSGAKKDIESMRRGGPATSAAVIRRAQAEERQRQEDRQEERERIRNGIMARQAQDRKSKGSPHKKAAPKKKAAAKRPAKKDDDDIRKGAFSSAVRSARAAKFREELHRRDFKGRFADKPGLTGGGAKATAERRKKMLDAMFGEAPPSVKAGRQGKPGLTGQKGKSKKTLGEKAEAAGDAAIRAAYSAEPPAEKPKPKAKKAAAPKPEKKPAQSKKAVPKVGGSGDEPPKTPKTPESADTSEEPKKPEGKRRFTKLDDVDALVADADSDAFVEVMKSLKAKDGRFKSKTKHSGSDGSISVTALVEDKAGNSRFLKRTAYNPESGKELETLVEGDVHTDIAISELFGMLGFDSQRVIGFGGDPNDLENASLVMGDVSEDHDGKTMERPLDGAKAVLEADWADRSEFVNMMIMDYLTANSDRHQNNWMEYEDEDGRHVVSIDTSMAGHAGVQAHTMAGFADARGYGSADYDDPEIDMSDPVVTAATRSFGGFMLEGYALSGDPDGNVASMEIPARVALLYEGDEEALRADVAAAIEKIQKLDHTAALKEIAKKHGITDDAALTVLDDLDYIMVGRLDEIQEGFDEMMESIAEAGFYLKKGGRTKAQHLKRRKKLTSTWSMA